MTEDFDQAARKAPRSIVRRPADHAEHGAANPTGSNGHALDCCCMGCELTDTGVVES